MEENDGKFLLMIILILGLFLIKIQIELEQVKAANKIMMERGK